MTAARPTLRFRPKMDTRRIRHGFPWVYANEAVTDRRTKALSPGTIATLEDAERRPLATVAVTSASKIIGRVLDRDPEAQIDSAWLHARVEMAFALRQRIYPSPYYRLVHAEGDGLPGLIIDRFGDYAVIQPNAAWIDRLLPELLDVLTEVTGVKTVVKNASGRARALEGLDSESGLLCGAVDAPVPVQMNGATYMADLVGGQKTGLFFDQRDNHAFVASLASGTHVLDVFSHVGGFALACLAQGATSAIAVDGSEPALQLARQGAAKSGLDAVFETRTSDAFAALEALKGEQFGTVICDPPAFAPQKSALDAGLRAYEKVARLAAPLVETGGTLTLCSCSHAASLDAFRTASLRGIGRAGRHAQVLRTGFASADHPQHPMLAETGYLKALTVRILR